MVLVVNGGDGEQILYRILLGLGPDGFGLGDPSGGCSKAQQPSIITGLAGAEIRVRALAFGDGARGIDCTVELAAQTLSTPRLPWTMKHGMSPTLTPGRMENVHTLSNCMFKPY